MVNNDDAFPQAWLYLDLHHEPLLSDSEDQRGHGFSFQTKTKTELDVAEPGRWFLCADILGLTDEESVHKQVTSGGLEAKHPGAEVLLGSAPFMSTSTAGPSLSPRKIAT